MNKKLITSLAKLAKVTDVDAFAEALKSESDTDFQLDIENFIVRTKQEDEEFKSNISKEVKDKAFSDAFEIQIKNMKKDLGLEFEGKKSDDFIKAFKSQILEQANIEPNKRISELETTLKNVQTNLEAKEQEFSNLKNGFSLEKNRLKAESLIPNLPDGIGLDKKEATDLFFLKHEVKDDGIYRDGVRMVNDTTATPLSIEDAINGFVTDRGWNQTPTGRGGGSGGNGSQKPNNVSTLDEFEQLAKEKGYNVGSREYNSLLSETVKENPSLMD